MPSYLNNEYDIEKAFRAIEDELMSSMIRNFDHHRAEELEEGYNWSMWQAEQLKALEKYKRDNKLKFSGKLSDINKSAGAMIQQARAQGSMKQEIAILKEIQNGYKPHIIPDRMRDYFNQFKGKGPKEIVNLALKRNVTSSTEGVFFKLNTRKMDALTRATTNDLKTAETAMLRMANDKYRKIIFNAQVYANTGAATYEKAVDMATKDFLSAGINCVEYKNGARHTLSEYSKMAIQTANKRAYLTGEGEKRQAWGITTVIMNKRGNACPKCVPFVGKILIDDVWSGGKASDGPYPLMSSAIAAGLYHPRCKDSHTTYFPELDDEPDDTYTKKDLKKIESDYKQDQEQLYAQRQADKFARLEKYSLDESNAECYSDKTFNWKDKTRRLKEVANDALTGNTKHKVESFKNSLETVRDADVKSLLERTINNVKFSFTADNNSKFIGKENMIYLNKYADEGTIAHELFHKIDNMYGITQSGVLSSTLNKDYIILKKRAEGYGTSIEDMLYKRYPNAFYINKNGKYKIKEQYRGISDILNGVSGGEIKLGYGHKDEYWKKQLKVQKEAFAQCGRILYTNDDKTNEMLNDLFKESMNEFKSALKRMAN